MKKIILYFLCFFSLFISRSFGQTGEKKGWPSSERYSFIGECIKTASVNISKDSARAYCYCMQSKIETKFPTVEEASKLTADVLQTPEWKKDIEACLGAATWDTNSRTDFLTECIAEAKKNLGESKAKTYCECMVFKVEARYPRPEDASSITEETFKSAGWQKLIKECMDF